MKRIENNQHANNSLIMSFYWITKLKTNHRMKKKY